MGRRRALPRERHLRALLRRGAVRRARHRRLARADRDRGGLEGLRDERRSSSPCRSSARSASSSPAATSRSSATCRSSRAASGCARTRSPRRAPARTPRRCARPHAATANEYVLNGSKRFITNASVANLYTVFAKTDPARATRHLRLRRRGGHARLRGGAARAEDGDQRLDDRRARVRRLPHPRGQPARRGGRGIQRSRCASSTARGPASPRRRSGSPRARPTTRSTTRRRARRWASRSRSTS